VHVGSLRLTDFRNYEAAELEFEPGSNLIVGSNGQGKTSLLEAIYCLSALASHRTSSPSTMVRHGATRALLHAAGLAAGRDLGVDAEIGRTGGIRVWVDKQLQTRRSRGRSLVSVLFSPEDLAIVKGGPEERRRFLDNAGARTRPMAVADRMDFERTLRQRNGALRAARVNPRLVDQLEVWNEQVAVTGAKVVGHRLAVLELLEPIVRQRYQELSSTPPPELLYRASWSDVELTKEPGETGKVLRAALVRFQDIDLERTVTTVGPHRDDLTILLAGVEARLYASQGEQRSISLTLRLAERDIIAEQHGEEPVLLLDDVFSELDEHRRQRLAELVSVSGQTVATATAAESLPIRGGRVFLVEEGRLRKVG
jgi:DNA replication and repair protein RecF